MSSTSGSISSTRVRNSSGTVSGSGVVPRRPARAPASASSSVVSVSCAPSSPPSSSSPHAAAKRAKMLRRARRRQRRDRLVMGVLLLLGRQVNGRRPSEVLSVSPWQTSHVGLPELRSRLAELDRVVVAFSGGADSALLAWAATDVLGADRALAVTAGLPPPAPPGGGGPAPPP